MRYPRKSYPHRCSPPCAKRARPRACARVYIIYRSPVGRFGEESVPLCPRGPRRRAQGGGGRGQRRMPPCAATRTFPTYGPAPARLRPNHSAQRRKCTRLSPPLPVRSSRVSPPTAEPLPLVCRITVRKGGSAQGNPRSCPPKTAPPPVYGRALCPLMGEVPSVGGGGRRQRRTPPRAATRTCLPTAEPLPAYRPAPAA